MDAGYEINLEHVCEFQAYTPEQVNRCELVFPDGAVPNAQLIWLRLELTSGERRFLTLPLQDFHKIVKLPVSSIGGWIDGEHGTDRFSDSRFAAIADEVDEPDLRG